MPLCSCIDSVDVAPRKILVVLASPNGDAAASTKFAKATADSLRSQPKWRGAKVTTRDVTALSHIPASAFPTWMAPKEQQLPAPKSDELIAELLAADCVVIGAPMHNFGPALGLKAWVDHVVRMGHTFTYGAKGPEPLLGESNKRAIVVMSSGGVPAGSPMDFVTPWLKVALGYIGIKDVQVVAAPGQEKDDDAVRASIAEVTKQ